MAAIRVFLLTYRRPLLLRRSLASLRAQTFTDWVCELHNDAPDDPFPGQLLAEINDPRITLHHHDRNQGAVACFNHAFGGGSEPYASILEDDNWWDPAFLASAHQTIEAHPAASMVWANMRIWQEQSDGKWTDTDTTIWPVPPSAHDSLRIFRWPEAIQCFDALHSNGAMLFRPQMFTSQTVPETTPLAIIENMRERCARGELILITAPLAHFAMTLQTSRSGNRAHWLQSQLLSCSSYFATVALTNQDLGEIWSHLRASRPRNTNLLFLTALALQQPWLLKPARFRDWILFMLNLIRHPLENLRGLRFRGDHPQVWDWMKLHTRPATLRTSPIMIDKQHCPPRPI